VACIIGRIVHQETRRWTLAALGMGLVFALYPVTGFWYDLARVDALFLLFVLSGLYIAQYHSHRSFGWWLSAGLMVLAYYTKQTAVLFAPIAALTLYKTSPRRAFYFLGLLGSTVLVISAVADQLTDGWYAYYVFEMVSGEPYIWSRITSEFWTLTWSNVPILLGLAVVMLVRQTAGRPWHVLLHQPWHLAWLLAMLNALLTWCRPGGFTNNFIPFYILLIIPATAALAAADRSGRPWLSMAAWIGLLAQFTTLGYIPADQIPDSQDRRAGASLLSLIHGLDGPVLIPEHPWYGVLAGKPVSYQSFALVDLQFHEGRGTWPEDLRDRLKNHHYSGVITAWTGLHASLGQYPPELEEFYYRAKEFRFPGQALGSRTGTPAVPRYLYLPALNALQKEGATLDFELGTYTGWHVQGTAFGRAPTRGSGIGQQTVGGYQGLYLVNSYLDGSDEAQGTLLSPRFLLSARVIRFRLGGGRAPGKLGVQLWGTTGLLRSASGRDSEQLREIIWDVSAWKGERVQIKVLDASSSPWGHVLFDDLRLEE